MSGTRWYARVSVHIHDVLPKLLTLKPNPCTRVYTSILKHTPFKDNIIKECRELFDVETWDIRGQKLDATLMQQLQHWCNSCNIDAVDATWDIRGQKLDSVISLTYSFIYTYNIVTYIHTISPLSRRSLTVSSLSQCHHSLIRSLYIHAIYIYIYIMYIHIYNIFISMWNGGCTQPGCMFATLMHVCMPQVRKEHRWHASTHSQTKPN